MLRARIIGMFAHGRQTTVIVQILRGLDMHKHVATKVLNIRAGYHLKINIKAICENLVVVPRIDNIIVKNPNFDRNLKNISLERLKLIYCQQKFCDLSLCG